MTEAIQIFCLQTPNTGSAMISARPNGNWTAGCAERPTIPALSIAGIGRPTRTRAACPGTRAMSKGEI